MDSKQMTRISDAAACTPAVTTTAAITIGQPDVLSALAVDRPAVARMAYAGWVDGGPGGVLARPRRQQDQQLVAQHR